MLRRNIGGGRVSFTTSYEEAADFADVHFIAVGTPQKHGELAADLSYVNSVIEALAPLLSRSSVIFGKSTVPSGTAARLMPAFVSWPQLTCRRSSPGTQNFCARDLG